MSKPPVTYYLTGKILFPGEAEIKLEIFGRSRNASFPAPFAQIPACGTTLIHRHPDRPDRPSICFDLEFQIVLPTLKYHPGD
jgi:hypothetical protein